MLRSLDTLTEAILEKASSSNVMSDSTLCRQLKVIIIGTVEDAQQAGRLRTSYTVFQCSQTYTAWLKI